MGQPNRCRIEIAHWSMASTLCSMRANSRRSPYAPATDVVLPVGQSMPMKAVTRRKEAYAYSCSVN